MMHYPWYFAGLLLTSLLAACSPEPGHQIPELPDFDEASYYEYALTAVDEVLADDPDNAEALFQRAELLLERGQAGAALTSIRRAIALDGHNPSYRLTRAEGLLQQGRNRAAVREAQSISGHEAALERYELLAEASLRSNYFADALRYSDSAIALAPRNYRNYLRKGQAAARTNDTLTAEHHLLRSLKLGAEATEVYGSLVDMYMDNDSYRQARIYMEKMLAQGRTDRRVRFQQARIMRMTGLLDSAQAILYRLRADSTVSRTPVYRELSELYYQKHRYDSALHYAEQVLAQRPEEKAMMLTAARSYDHRYRYQRAIRQYEAIVGLDSLQQADVHQTAVQELATLRRKVRYLWKKKQEEAFEQLKRVAPVQRIAPTSEPPQ